MPLANKLGLKLFQFNNLSSFRWIKHFLTTKDVGNVSTFRTDDKVAVRKNRKVFFDATGIREADVVEANQVHGNHVALVGRSERGHIILKTDALITDTQGVVLFVRVADCVPVFLVDAIKHAVGIVHAGWRGTAQEVVRLAVNHMEDHFGTRVEDLVVGIGPSIGPCCYEVDTLVVDAFKKFPYANRLFTKRHGEHANLDLWEANKLQLVERGVKEENIEVAGLCTKDNPEIFFSDRKLGANAPGGRFGGIIWINN